jgi:hypothetical protein
VRDALRDGALGEQPPPELGVVAEEWIEHLERDPLSGGAVLGEEHAGGAAAREGSDHVVAAELALARGVAGVRDLRGALEFAAAIHRATTFAPVMPGRLESRRFEPLPGMGFIVAVDSEVALPWAQVSPSSGARAVDLEHNDRWHQRSHVSLAGTRALGDPERGFDRPRVYPPPR